jgi:hypothetical protein
MPSQLPTRLQTAIAAGSLPLDISLSILPSATSSPHWASVCECVHVLVQRYSTRTEAAANRTKIHLPRGRWQTTLAWESWSLNACCYLLTVKAEAWMKTVQETGTDTQPSHWPLGRKGRPNKYNFTMRISHIHSASFISNRSNESGKKKDSQDDYR